MCSGACECVVGCVSVWWGVCVCCGVCECVVECVSV